MPNPQTDERLGSVLPSPGTTDPGGTPAGTPQHQSDSALGHARSIIALIFGPAGTREFSVRYWTGQEEPAATERARFTICVRSAGSLRRMLFPPNELSIIEAVLSGDVDIEGDIEAAMSLGDAINDRLKSPGALLALGRHLLKLPREDASTNVRELRSALTVGRVGGEHEPHRDRAAIKYHYDVGNDFYALWLDGRMVYSCAYYESDVNVDEGLDTAQAAKLDLICRKLRLAPGDRLLDVGCGWGGLIMHAVENFGVTALGITLSDAQAELARERIAARGLADRCEVEIRDYRSLQGLGLFDKISSVGMVEHVGVARLPEYFQSLYAALAQGGLFLNHGIVSTSAARRPSRWDWIERRLWKRDVFIEQYVFPDGRLGSLEAVIGAAEREGFFTIDMESLREHYALTLRAWLVRLGRRSAEAIALTDERIYRTWRLYMAGSAHGFATGSLNVVQTLLAKPGASGGVKVPLRRGYMFS